MEKKKYSWIFFTAFPILLALVSFLWWLIGYGPSEGLITWGRGFQSLEEAALFGDSFGYVNSLFSAFAFTGVAVAILLQLHEIKEGRKMQEEIREDQEEIRRSMGMQADALFLSNYFEIERRLMREKHDLEDLERSSYKSAERAKYERQVNQSREIVKRLERVYELMEPHAEKVMEKMGKIVGGDGVRAHLVKGNYSS